MTPEGVPLIVEIADLFERCAAFGIDFFITDFAGLVLVLGAGLLSGSPIGDVTLAAALFATFVVRNLYFIWFEILWAGSTPGKRVLGLRVVDRGGGPLTSGAVVARNLSREVETFFPLAMVASAASWTASPWEVFPLAAWLLLTTSFPLLNKDNMRAGDLLGGTVVIAVPQRVLLDDLAVTRGTFRFSVDQLQRYGILELHVLEDVLRRPESLHNDRLLGDIALKIQRRISWHSQVAPRDTRAFLSDFYTAQRAFLERRKHLGDERADKHFALPEESSQNPTVS